MKKLIVIIAVLAFSSTAFAKKEQNVKFDMKDTTCKELIEADEDSAGVILMWLDGYLSGITGDTKFDSNEFGSFAGSLGEFCAKNPTAKVLEASQKLGVQQ